MAAPMSKDELLQKLKEIQVDTHTVEHPEVFTVEEALPHFTDNPGIFAKNLFLKDKKKNFWLYCAPHFVDVKLNDLGKQVGAPGGLRFADEAVLVEALGVRQGAVTVFGLVNDTQHRVRLILHSSLWQGESSAKATAQADDTLSAKCEESSQAASVQSSNAGSGNDGDTKVEVEHDAEKRIYFHPLVNTASTGITRKGLKDFLEYTGHTPVIAGCKSDG